MLEKLSDGDLMQNLSLIYEMDYHYVTSLKTCNNLFLLIQVKLSNVNSTWLCKYKQVVCYACAYIYVYIAHTTFDYVICYLEQLFKKAFPFIWFCGKLNATTTEAEGLISIPQREWSCSHFSQTTSICLFPKNKFLLASAIFSTYVP